MEQAVVDSLIDGPLLLHLSLPWISAAVQDIGFLPASCHYASPTSVPSESDLPGTAAAGIQAPAISRNVTGTANEPAPEEVINAIILYAAATRK